MIGPTLATLPAVAAELLTTFTTALQTLGVELPADRDGTVISYLVASPTAAVPGPCLRVAFVGIDRGTPGRPTQQAVLPGALQFYAVFHVELYRRYPAVNTTANPGKGQQPSLDKITTAALQLIDDASALTLAARSVQASYAVAAVGTPIAILPVEPLGPDGAQAGNRCTVAFTVL